MAGTDPAPSLPRVEPDPAWHGIDPTLRDSRRVEDPFPALHHLRRVAPVNELLAPALAAGRMACFACPPVST